MGFKALTIVAAASVSSIAGGFCLPAGTRPITSSTTTTSRGLLPSSSSPPPAAPGSRSSRLVADHRSVGVWPLRRAARRVRCRSNASLRMGANDESVNNEPKSNSERSASSQTEQRERQGVSRAFNRALGSILSAGDMFGGIGGGSGRSLPGLPSISPATQAIAGADNDRRAEENGEDDGAAEEEQVEEGDGDYMSDDEDDINEQDASDGAAAAAAAATDGRPMWRRLGQKRRKNTNRLLRARTRTSAGIVVDGPFSALEAYMTLPVAEYSLLDSSIICRVSETAFRLQIPLRDLVGLDFTPTMEVEVELDSKAKAVVVRSTRSSLYGNVGMSEMPGKAEGAGSASTWPAPSSNKIEYFRVCFDSHLRWTNGDASVEPRRRRGVKNAFAGEVARRPRPAPRSPQPTPMATGAGAVAPLPPPSASLLPDSESSGASVLDVNERPGVFSAAVKEAELRAQRATVFCDTEVAVQVLLPPPYNTVLPWRLVRALIGKVLSTVLGYALPRFLELLADDFYGWQSGTRRAPATAGDTTRTLLGPKGQSANTNTNSDLQNRASSIVNSRNSGAGAPRGAQGDPLTESERRQDMVGNTGEKAGSNNSNHSNNNKNKNINNNSNFVGRRMRGGVKLLRNIRGPGGRGRDRVSAGGDESEATSAAATTAEAIDRVEATVGGAEGGVGTERLETRSTMQRANQATLDALYEWATADAGVVDYADEDIDGNQEEEDRQDEEEDMREEEEDVEEEDRDGEEVNGKSRGPAWLPRRPRGWGGGGGGSDGVGDGRSSIPINWWG